MTNIDDSRKKIEEIDEKMAQLFEERLLCSKGVAEYKKAHGLPLLDQSREKALLEQNLHYLQNDVTKEYYPLFLQNIMDLSKKYQSRLNDGMKVAYAGTKGAYANIASEKLFPGVNYVPFVGFDKAYRACEKGEVDVCVLPIENSYAGDVGLVMDLLFQRDLYINQVIDIDIDHNLLACKEATLDSVKEVYSHEQALAQCTSFIKENHLKANSYENTALAAEYVSMQNDPTICAIASKETAELYGLKILASNINENRNNTTKFVALSRNRSVSVASCGINSIIVFTVKNEAGSLAKVLNIIGVHGFNMLNLRSRPLKTLMWNYYFYVEIDGNIDSKDGIEMMKQLSRVCDKLKVVGTYKG